MGQPFGRVKMIDLSILSDFEFENLIGDLIEAEVEGNPRIERFTKGRDGGIDLRWKSSSGTNIIQCKHYIKSTVSQLLSSAAHEKTKLDSLRDSGEQIENYYFVTSLGLTPKNKNDIFERIKAFTKDTGYIWGNDDIQALLRKHHEIYRNNIKLWLSDYQTAFSLSNSSTEGKTAALLIEIDDHLEKYVETKSFHLARQILNVNSVCIISGDPGVGKTTLAYLIIADKIKDGYKPVVIDNIETAFSYINNKTKIVFFYDDFLGKSRIHDQSTKNESNNLRIFMHRVKKTNHSFILTTREYLLAETIDTEEGTEFLGDDKYLLEIEEYNSEEKSLILYNHAYKANLDEKIKQSIFDFDFRRIVNHKNFYPRLVEHAFLNSFIAKNYDNFFESIVTLLDNPSRIWEKYIRNHLNIEDKIFLACLSIREQSNDESIFEIFLKLFYIMNNSSILNSDYKSILKRLEGTLIKIQSQESTGKSLIIFKDPSIKDYFVNWLGDEKLLVINLLDCISSPSELNYFYKYFMLPNDAEDSYTKKFEEALDRVIFCPEQDIIIDYPLVDKLGFIYRNKVYSQSSVGFLNKIKRKILSNLIVDDYDGDVVFDVLSLINKFPLQEFSLEFQDVHEMFNLKIKDILAEDDFIPLDGNFILDFWAEFPEIIQEYEESIITNYFEAVRSTLYDDPNLTTDNIEYYLGCLGSYFYDKDDIIQMIHDYEYMRNEYAENYYSEPLRTRVENSARTDFPNYIMQQLV